MKSMEKLKLILIAGIISASLLFQSCSNDDGYSLGDYWLSVATVESLDGGSHYFKMDNGTTLWPAAGYYLGHNLAVGQRTWLNFTILSDKKDGFDHYVKVNGVDPILTKEIAEDKGEENDSYYGTDPVAVKDIWVGGGYLNVIFKFNYGGMQKHFINLLPVTDSENPYEVEFRHHAYKDPAEAAVAGIVCFDLSSLPKTEGETVKLKVHFKTFNGEKTFELEYNSDKETVTEEKSGNTSLNINFFETIN
ncbi:NigD-like protein [Parabacteroides sp. PFB2-10]|uniref:NigD-like protein n=1 Tax=Parabacteroides sp. PFB2-10 TaxID=1742405 RepID=UPI0024758672|nr:NigD-like protein [Parabacteroides sp. PFB2-10]